MKAENLLRQKQILKHKDGERFAIFEFVIWQVAKTKDYPSGIKYRAWLSENGETLLGFDNHKPKGPHLHIGDREIGYVFRGFPELKNDIIAMIKGEGFLYED